MKTTHRVAALVLSAVCCVAIAATAPKGGKTTPPEKSGIPRFGMTVYSDLCVHPGSGEFGGQRITLQRFAEVDTVIYEYTAGGLSWPLVANDVNIDPRGKMMYFTVQPPDEAERTISGKFSPDGESLTLEGGYCGEESGQMTLAKVKDFSQKPKSCRACAQPKKAPADMLEVPPAQG